MRIIINRKSVHAHVYSNIRKHDNVSGVKYVIHITYIRCLEIHRKIFVSG